MAKGTGKRKTHGNVTVITKDYSAGLEAGSLELAVKEFSKQIPEELNSHAIGATAAEGGYAIIEPHFNPVLLAKLPNMNNTLKQCIAAMETNIESFGHGFEYVGPDGQKDSPEAVAELASLTERVSTPNDEYSLIEFRKRLRKDKETLGYMAVEVVRKDKDIVAWYHLPGHLVRLTHQGDPIMVDRVVVREGKVVRRKAFKSFRRFVQIVGGKRIWFKEFGDPRNYDCETGAVLEVTAGVPEERIANEVVFDAFYEAGFPYGMPRWINQLPSILGSRESELTNLRFFEDNGIPALAILVSGGFLTDDTIESLQQKFSGVKGSDAINRIVIIEAEPDSTEELDGERKMAPRLEIKPLAGERQNDELFQEYDKNCQDKVRSSFRLPPLLLGKSSDYTRATAQSSLDTSESQVFAPERSQMDDLFNFKLLQSKEGTPPRFWRFRSNRARITGADTIVETIETMDKIGAMTPNFAISLMNELFDLKRSKIDSEWGDMPFAVLTAMLRSSSSGAAAMPEEVEQIAQEVEELKKAFSKSRKSDKGQG